MTTGAADLAGVPQKASPKYQGLQLLRTLACGMVLVHHSLRFVSLDAAPGVPVWYGGIAGVDLFFVLSGFVMVYSSQRLMRESNGWRVFVRRRLIRITPMYWLATAAMLPALWHYRATLPLPQHLGVWALGSFLFLPARGLSGEVFPVLAVGWTLNFEMLFYALFAAALLLRRNVYAFVGAALCLLSAGAAFRRPSWPAAAFYLDPIVLEFFAGMVVARLCLSGRRLPGWLAWTLAAAALADLLRFPIYTAPLRALELGLPSAVLVYAVASLEEHFSRLSVFLLVLAESSYVLYLVHVPIIQALTRVLPRLGVQAGWQDVACCLVMPLLLATGLHLWLERPLLAKLRDRFDPGRPKVRSAVEPVVF